MRIAIYARVSTEEQSRHGLSIETQLNNLREWAKNNGHIIVREYIDAGVSGKKPFTKRAALSQFVKELEAGLSVDALVFTKLDRFFRSVKHYYQAVSELDKYKVGWQAIQEDYETLTSAGRFKVNIMLSVAEAEADRTSERIKVVMEAKRQKREAPTGHVPIGYKVENKKIVKDESKALIVETLFAEYLKTHSIKAACDAVEEKTGYHFFYRHASDTLKNQSYYGKFYGIEDFAPAYIEKSTFDKVCAMRKKITRTPKENNVYLFPGLFICGECGGAMSPRTQKDRKASKPVYNCRGRYEKYVCDNCVNIYESDVENYLLSTLDFRAEQYKIQLAREKAEDNSGKIAALKKKRQKLSELYLADLISIEDAKSQKNEIDKKIAELSAIPQKKENIELPKNWREMYESISRKGKKAFWLSLLSKIVIYKDRRIEYYF